MTDPNMVAAAKYEATTSGGIGPFSAVIYPELHSVLGFAFLMAFLVYLPLSWFWYSFLIIEVVVVNKEVWFDPIAEGKTNGKPNQPFFWEGAKDLLWWNVGFVAFFLGAVLKHIHL